MQIDAQDFLRLVEKAKTLVTWDIESTGLGGDYNSILVLSAKSYGVSAIKTFAVSKPGIDRTLVREARDYLNQADCWITYYGKGFDVKMLNTRLLEHNMAPLRKVPHIDMYFTLKPKLLTKRKSQGHLLNWLETENDQGKIAEKMSVSANVWNKVIADPGKYMPRMRARCESDCRGLESLYRRTKHLIGDITR